MENIHDKSNGLFQSKRCDHESRCTFSVEKSSNDSPHKHYHRVSPKGIFDSVLDLIGGTPLVRLNRIPKNEHIQCEILVKCEFYNAGGSVKDRIGLRMIEDAERDGKIKPGDTLIEPTSGNTGIAIALAAAVKGYKCIIVMPEKMSIEKVNILRALGANIVRTPTAASYLSSESHIGVANKMMSEIPHSHILDQYTNPSNPLAHYDETAEEILRDCDGKVDMIVLGAGTGGTLTGIARKIKQKCPNCLIVGVDPVGSIIAEPDILNASDSTFYEVEGIGYDFLPTVCDRSLVDMWFKSKDKESFKYARRLINEEGLLCGGSSGSALSCAIRAIRHYKLGADKRVVVVLPDSIRNYMSKFLNDDWMIARGFMQEPEVKDKSPAWMKQPIRIMNLNVPLTVRPSVSVEQTLNVLQRESFDQMPVVDENEVILGMVTLASLMSAILRKQVQPTDPVSLAMYKNFNKISIEAPMSKLSRLLDLDYFVLVIQQHRLLIPNSKEELSRDLIYGIVTRMDLLNFITTAGSRNGCAKAAAETNGEII